MPYKSVWIDPELLLEHKGVRVCHTYDGDDYDQGRMRYDFTTTPEENLENSAVFNILNLNVPSSEKLRSSRPSRMEVEKNPALARQRDIWREEIEPALIKAVVYEAIEAGLIVSDEE